MSNYFILHGSCGHPFENWFPWLQRELETRGKEVLVPTFPCGKNQNYENWSKILEQYLEMGMIQEETIFIGHSLAPIFICRFLIEHKVKVKGIISVSGFDLLLGLELDEVNKTFIMDKSLLETVTEYTEFVYCFYSDNDPYISLEELEDFANRLKAEKCIIKGAGHFNTNAGYTTFPQILEVIKSADNGMSFLEGDDMPVGVNCIVLNEKGELLLAKRKNRFGEGTYSLVGGKLKEWESLEECAIRELKEETGLEVNKEDIEIVNLDVTMDARHILQIGAIVKKYKGVLENREPHKCEELAFFSLETLPELFCGTKGNIALFKKQAFYEKDKNK